MAVPGTLSKSGWDGRQHKQRVVRYELVTEVGPCRSQLVWHLSLPCGHTVLRTGGRLARPGEFGAQTINGVQYICVPREVACDTCRSLHMMRTREAAK